MTLEKDFYDESIHRYWHDAEFHAKVHTAVNVLEFVDNQLTDQEKEIAIKASILCLNLLNEDIHETERPPTGSSGPTR